MAIIFKLHQGDGLPEVAQANLLQPHPKLRPGELGVWAPRAFVLKQTWHRPTQSADFKSWPQFPQHLIGICTHRKGWGTTFCLKRNKNHKIHSFLRYGLSPVSGFLNYIELHLWKIKKNKEICRYKYFPNYILPNFNLAK